MPLETPLPAGPKFGRVIKTEEKGSAVNLATHLVNDAYENHFDVAVPVTNDSDLKEPRSRTFVGIRDTGPIGPRRDSISLSEVS